MNCAPLKHTDPNGHMPCEFYCPGDYIIGWQVVMGYAGDIDPRQQAANRAKVELAVAVGDAVWSVVWEPYDWASTAARCSQGECNWLDYAGFLPLIPGALGRSGDAARVYRNVDRLEDAADAIGQGFRKFTYGNFRENLRRLTGRAKEGIKGLEAHHVLPQKFAEQFEKIGNGINIHDPRFGA